MKKKVKSTMSTLLLGWLIAQTTLTSMTSVTYWANLWWWWGDNVTTLKYEAWVDAAKNSTYGEKNIPYHYNSYFPTHDWLHVYGNDGWKAVVLPIVSEDGKASWAKNVLGLQSAATDPNRYTPWYASQSYLVFPKDSGWKNFWDIKMSIENFSFYEQFWPHIKPVVSVVYYDENNSPILTSFDTAGWVFNPIDHMIFWNEGNTNPWECGGDTNWRWCRAWTNKTTWGWTVKANYRMDFTLPFSKFNDRINNVDYDNEKSDAANKEAIKLSPVKYAKITVSFMSVVDNNWNSTLRCGNLRNDTLISYDTETFWKLNTNNPLSYWFTVWSQYSEFTPDKVKTIIEKIWKTNQGQAFANGTRFNINSLVSSLWSDMAKHPGVKPSELITNYIWNFYQAKSYFPNGADRFLVNNQTEQGPRTPIRKFNPATGQFEVVDQGNPTQVNSEKLPLYRGYTTANITSEDLKSRNTIQNILSLRNIYKNIDVQISSLWPDVITVNGTKNISKAGISLDSNKMWLSEQEINILKRSTFTKLEQNLSHISSSLADGSHNPTADLKRPLTVVIDTTASWLDWLKKARIGLYDQTDGITIKAYNDAPYPNNEYEELTTIINQVNDLARRSSWDTRVQTYLKGLLDEYLSFYNERRENTIGWQTLINYKLQGQNKEESSQASYEILHGQNGKIKDLVANWNYIWLYNRDKFDYLYHSNSITNKSIETKKTNRERITQAGNNLFYDEQTSSPESFGWLGLTYLNPYLKWSFSIDDCNKVYIEYSTLPNKAKAGWYRVLEIKWNLENYWKLVWPDKVTYRSENLIYDQASTRNATWTVSNADNETLAQAKNQKYRFKKYSSWAWFGHSLYWNHILKDSTKNNSTMYRETEWWFTYNIWMKSFESWPFAASNKDNVIKKGMPEFLWGSPTYDWKEGGPIISTWSRGSITWTKEQIAKKIQEKKDLTKQYCDTLEWEPYYQSSSHKFNSSSQCLNVHDFTSPEYNPGHEFYSSYYDYSSYLDAMINWRLEMRKAVEETIVRNNPTATLSGIPHLDAKNYSDFSKLFRTLDVRTNDLWGYVRVPTFFWSIPYTVRKESEYSWTSTLSYKVNPDRSDWTIAWQTFWPRASYHAAEPLPKPLTSDATQNSRWQKLSWRDWWTSADGTAAIAFNLTLPQGEEYLEIWSYDIDSATNGWNPPSKSTYMLRPVFEDLTEDPNSDKRLTYGPYIIVINGPWDPNKWELKNDIIAWQKTFYSPSWKVFDSTNSTCPDWLVNCNLRKVNELGRFPAEPNGDWKYFLGKEEIKIPVRTSLPVYNLAWPEGNDETSFYKINLKKLKEELTKAYESSSDPEVKKLAKYLNAWEFTDSNKSKKNITFRLVIRWLDCTWTYATWNDVSSNCRHATSWWNIIYFTSNGISGWKALDESQKSWMTNSLELLNSRKFISLDKSSWIGTRYYKPKSESSIIKWNIPGGTTYNESQTTDLLQMRIYASHDKRELTSPYLYTTIYDNLISLPLSDREKAQFDLIRTSAGERTNKNRTYYTELEEGANPDDETPKYKYLKYSNLAHWTISEDRKKITINDKEYIKQCIYKDVWIEPAFFEQVSADSANAVNWQAAMVAVNKPNPHQYICYYTAPDIDISNPDNQRLTLVDTDKYLPFVDVYVKVQVKDQRDPLKERDGIVNSINITKRSLDGENYFAKLLWSYNSLLTSEADIARGSANVSVITDYLAAQKIPFLSRIFKKDIWDKNWDASKNIDRWIIRYMIWGDKMWLFGQYSNYKEYDHLEKLNNHIWSLFYDINENGETPPPITPTFQYCTIPWTTITVPLGPDGEPPIECKRAPTRWGGWWGGGWWDNGDPHCQQWDPNCPNPPDPGDPHCQQWDPNCPNPRDPGDPEDLDDPFRDPGDPENLDNNNPNPGDPEGGNNWTRIPGDPEHGTNNPRNPWDPEDGTNGWREPGDPEEGPRWRCMTDPCPSPLKPNPGDPENPAVLPPDVVLPDDKPVIVPPKLVLRPGSKAICNLQIIPGEMKGIQALSGDHLTPGEVIDVITPDRPLVGWESMWVDWTVTKDKLWRPLYFKYKVTWANNIFSYKIRYKLCGTDTYEEQESPTISFKTNHTLNNSSLCHIQYTWTTRIPNTAPELLGKTKGTPVSHGQKIDYRIYCKNDTGADIYNLKVKLPKPSNTATDYETWIKEEFVELWTLPAWDEISYKTNPQDLTKTVKIADGANAGEVLVATLEYKYKKNVDDTTEIIEQDQIDHNVERLAEDLVTMQVLRGSCNGTNQYPYNGSTTWTARYPFIIPSWMCVATTPGTNANGQPQVTNNNKACLSVKYFRLGKDTEINKNAYGTSDSRGIYATSEDINQNPDLEYGNWVSIWWITNNLTPNQRFAYRWWGRYCRASYTLHEDRSCSNSISNASGWDWKEGAVRSQYSKVKASIDVELPSILKIDPARNANAYTSFDASIAQVSRADMWNKKYKYTIVFNDQFPNTQRDVMNSSFQKVLKDGSSYNRARLDKPLFDLRISLLAEGKWSDRAGNEKNYKNEVTTDNQSIKVTHWQISFERKRWMAFDNAVRCEITDDGDNSCGTIYRSEAANDYTTIDKPISTIVGKTFTEAKVSETPVCVSWAWNWIQVLNGAMHTDKTSWMTNIEHSLDPNTSSSYNTNWFLTQSSGTNTPRGFFQRRPQDNTFNLDQKFTTDTCYKYDRSKNEYDYSTVESVKDPTDITSPTSWQCSDWSYPWFYAIRKWLYGYLYEFKESQLKGLMETWINLDLDAGGTTNIRNRVWVYNQSAHNNKWLVLGKQSVKEIKMSWLWNIFVTKDLTNLSNKTAVVNISSNIVYNSNEIKTGEKPEDVQWDAMAVVINGNLVIWSKVEKIEWMFFVDWDVIVEESRNMLEIDWLYVTGKVIVKRKATTNNEIDDLTGSTERPVFRVTWWKKRYQFLQPKLLQSHETYYKEDEVEANNTNFDCNEHGICNTGS